MQRRKPNSQPEYDDSYATCVRTYSTLRIFSENTSPDEITELLRIKPMEAFRKGEAYNAGKLERKVNGWFYTTKDLSLSRDTRRHIDLILTALDGKHDVVQQLHAQRCEMDVTSYWDGIGQGGPWLMPYQMLKLGALGLAVWWDIYFSEDAKDFSPS